MFWREPCQHTTHAVPSWRLTCIHTIVSWSPWAHGSVAPDKRHCQEWTSSLFCGFCLESPESHAISLQLHWLPVSQRIVFKLMLIVHISVNNIAPIYISELLKVYTPSRNLRSSNMSLLKPQSHWSCDCLRPCQSCDLGRSWPGRRFFLRCRPSSHTIRPVPDWSATCSQLIARLVARPWGTWRTITQDYLRLSRISRTTSHDWSCDYAWLFARLVVQSQD